MGTTITFRRGENDPTSGSGLTLAEPAFNTTLKTFHIGLGHGVTAAWVGAPISGASAEIAAGITYKTPTLKAVKDYVTDYVTAVNGVLTVNGFAGGVTLNAGTAIGVTASGGNITVTNLGVQSFNGSTGAVQGVSSWNGQTGAVSFVNYVVSFNGLTGAVGGVTTSAANTFVPMQSFSGGISAAGGTFSKLAVFISGIDSAGITASTVTSDGTSTIPGYPGYASTTTVSADTIKFVFDGVGGQILRPTNDNIDGSPRTNYLPASSGTLALTSQLMGAVNGSLAATTAVTSFNGRTGAVQGVSSAAAGTGISVSAATGAVTITNTGVQSFNGNTGAVTGASLGANTFTGLNSFNAGVSATGLTVGGSEGIEITRRLPTGAFLGEVNFIKGLSAELRVGNISGSVMVFNGSTASVFSPNYSLTISKGGIEGYPITGNYAAAVRFDTKTGLDFGTATLAPISGYTTDRTINLPNASGTVALTSQLMGAVNGSTAATTAVTSFNGRTGAVQGVSAAVAGTGISVSGATGSVTITNTGVQSFNGLTGAVTGVTVGGANTFTALNSFNAGISASGATFSGDIAVNGGDITTTATTATLYNTNAITVTIGSSAGSVTVSSGNTSGMTFGMGFYHKFKTNRVETLTTLQTEIFRFNYKNASLSVVGGLDAAYAEIIITAEQTPGFGACSGTQITKLLIASNPADATVFHTEYGNVNTNGNLASYTASISGNDVIVYATPTSSDYTIFKVLATLIRGEFGEGV